MTSKELITNWDPPIMNKKEWQTYIKKERKYFLYISLFLLFIGLIGIFINYISLKDFLCYLTCSPFIIIPIFIILVLLELKFRKLQNNPVPSSLVVENRKLKEITEILERFLSNTSYKKIMLENSKIKKSHTTEYKYLLNSDLYLSILVSQYTKKKYICIGYTFNTYTDAKIIQDEFSSFFQMQVKSC